MHLSYEQTEDYFAESTLCSEKNTHFRFFHNP